MKITIRLCAFIMILFTISNCSSQSNLKWYSIKDGEKNIGKIIQYKWNYYEILANGSVVSYSKFVDPCATPSFKFKMDTLEKKAITVNDNFVVLELEGIAAYYSNIPIYDTLYAFDKTECINKARSLYDNKVKLMKSDPISRDRLNKDIGTAGCITIDYSVVESGYEILEVKKECIANYRVKIKIAVSGVVKTTVLELNYDYDEESKKYSLGSHTTVFYHSE